MLSEIQSPIKPNLKQFSEIFRESLSCDLEIINQMGDYLMSIQGKQMRPLFLLLTSQMLGGINDKCYYAATLIELIHTASLVHDDIVDEAYVRRNQWSLNALYRSKNAVLAGDYVLARALRIGVENQLYSLIDSMAQVIEEMAKGELMQSDFSQKLNITSQQYYQVIRRKTALLLATCGSAGTSCSGASKEDIDTMFQFGEALGMAFQIKDDILDYTKKSLITGKIACNDLKERKLTLPIITILEDCSTTDRKHILSLVRKADRDNKAVTQLRDIVISRGGVEMATREMENFKIKAVKLLERYPDSESKSALIKYADFVLKREK